MKNNSPLKIICVGTGRDGTTSLAEMIQCIFDDERLGRKVMHEWASVELYENFCNYAETKNEAYMEKIRDILINCPYDCIVGNGYASILPEFAKLFGSQITLVHLRRRDREACVASLVRNAELFPVNHKYYADSSSATGKRIAAFHYGEASWNEWVSWPISRKFSWYYDKTHALVDSGSVLFPKVIQAETESFGTPELRIALGAAAGRSYVPPSVHLNKHYELDFISEDRRTWIQRFLGKLDIARLAYDDIYGTRHALKEFTTWMTFRIGDGTGHSFDTVREFDAVLNEAREVLQRQLGNIDELSTSLGLNPKTTKKIYSQTDMNRLLGELKVAREEIDRLEKNLNVLQNSTRLKIEHAKKEWLVAQEISAHLQRELNVLRNSTRLEIERIRKEQLVAQEESAHLQRELDAIRSSNSWRITQPLRDIVMWIRARRTAL